MNQTLQNVQLVKQPLFLRLLCISIFGISVTALLIIFYLILSGELLSIGSILAMLLCLMFSVSSFLMSNRKKSGIKLYFLSVVLLYFIIAVMFTGGVEGFNLSNFLTNLPVIIISLLTGLVIGVFIPFILPLNIVIFFSLIYLLKLNKKEFFT